MAAAAFKSHGRGTLIIKGTFAGVSIVRASGTNDPARLRDLVSMLKNLAGAGRRDLLQLAAKPKREGGIAFLELWEHYRRGDWSHMPTAEHAQRLKPALESWRLKVAGERRRKDLASTIRCLLDGMKKPTVGDLAAVLLAYRTDCATRGRARMFNKARSEVSSFIRDTYTQDHPLWMKVRAVAPLKVQRTWKPNPQRPDAAATIRELLGGSAGVAWWALCCTGMMPDEYFAEKWRLEDGRLHVLGTKVDGHRDRFVPLLVPPPAPTLGQEQFQRLLKRARLGVRPYDARHTFAHWCDLAGIPAIRKDRYLGHAVGPVTYGWHESERFLAEDEARLQALLGGIIGGTEPADRPESDAPRWNRTINLLIKSQTPASPSPTADDDPSPRKRAP